MTTIRIWLPFLSILTLTCGSILAIGMGWQTDYLEMRRRATQDARTAAEHARQLKMLDRTLVAAELPRVSSVLQALRAQTALRREVFARMDALSRRFPDQDAAAAAMGVMENELARLTKCEQDLENKCWELAAARTSWRENQDMLVMDESHITGSTE